MACLESRGQGKLRTCRLPIFNPPQVEAFPLTKVEHNPASLFPPYRNYSHGVEVVGSSRLLFISGLNGYQSDGETMPESFEEQGELIWNHIGQVLESAQMSYADIVSLRTYLSSPEHDEANVKLRVRFLGENKPASTVVCCQLLESRWKLEIEAVAAR